MQHRKAIFFIIYMFLTSSLSAYSVWLRLSGNDFITSTQCSWFLLRLRSLYIDFARSFLFFLFSLAFVVHVECRINTTLSNRSNIKPFYNLQTATKEKKSSIKFTFKTSNVIKLFNAISLSAFFLFPFLLLKFNVFFFWCVHS